MNVLKLDTFPLSRHALIEASAGTGKTYAVANLYLRYLLERHLDVSQILVVTFTEAATQELKDRIRARIKELLAVYDDEASDDEFLMNLYRSSSTPIEDRLLLKLAEREIDQAQIYTIHGFCQQVLSRHALDIGISFEQTLIEDETLLRQQVAQDFWRKDVLNLPDAALAEVVAKWAGPVALLDELLTILNRRPERIIPDLLSKKKKKLDSKPDHDNGLEENDTQESPLSQWLGLFERHQNWFLNLKTKISQVYPEVLELLESSDLKRLNDKLNWWHKLGEWAGQSEDMSFPSAGSRKNLLGDFTPDALASQTKKGGRVPEHFVFEAIAEALQSMPEPIIESFLSLSSRILLERLNAEKRQQGALSFDDLIYLLAEAIAHQDKDSTLLTSLRSRFKVGLIDEFQDTDKAQYQIFSSIFMGDESDQNTAEQALVLIGDPKQAIYAFRGGDISTYLQAKRDITNHDRAELYTMDTNWRSAKNMVDAVNYLFSETSNAFISEEIPFLSVNAAMQSFEENHAAIQISCLEHENFNKEKLSQVLANRCVHEVLGLLKQPHVANHDIAILVRSSHEAELVRSALGYYGLAASYEARSSIYDSEEAFALALLLKAVSEPNNEFYVRQCLSSLFFGQSDDTLKQLLIDDTQLLAYFELFERLNDECSKHGVLAMIRRCLSELELYKYWHEDSVNKEGAWERHLSNLNQLAEVLQQRFIMEKSIQALSRWFSDLLLKGHKESGEDEATVRLESDEQLIKIVTIHKSKGLEYPYVFIPFLFHARAADEYWFYDKDRAFSLDLTKNEKYASQVDLERISEDMRLLYVALTRSKYRCYIGTAFYKGARTSLGVGKTAWGKLVFKGKIPAKMNEEHYHDALNQIAALASGLISVECLTDEQVLAASNQFNQRLKPSLAEPMYAIRYQQRVFGRQIKSNWKVQSFTGLIREHDLKTAAVGFHGLSYEEVLASESERFSQLQGHVEDINIFGFPKGSHAGTFLHTLFEDIELSTAEPKQDKLIGNGSLQSLIQFKLERSGIVEEGDICAWSEYLEKWVRNVLQVPLANGLSLSQLSESDYQAELEFYVKVEHLKVGALNSLLGKYGYQPILFESFEGLLKGAIDLVCRYDGSFYLIDYKSNYLGDEISDYTRSSMQAAIDEHRYDIQYLIYTLAFHRYLKHRLGERYNYEEHFGGVIYLFLRGLDLDALGQSAEDRESQLGIYFKKPDADLILALDSLMSDCTSPGAQVSKGNTLNLRTQNEVAK